MTIEKFGRVMPIHMDMLCLVGYAVRGRRVTLDISPYEKIEWMIQGQKGLQWKTGMDFGFDLSAWREFLITNPSFGYTHPYAFSGVDRAVKEAILDEKRPELIEIILQLEIRGKELLESLLTSSSFAFDESLTSNIPSTGGIYLISEVNSEQPVSVYLGQSQNMFSHIMGKHVRSIVRRRYERQSNTPEPLLRDVYRVQFISVDDTERDWFVKFAIEALRPLAYD